jgi:hypothetical protein
MQSVSSGTKELTHIMIRSNNTELIIRDEKRFLRVALLFVQKRKTQI